MDVSELSDLRVGESVLESYQVKAILNPDVSGILHLTTQRLVLSWLPKDNPNAVPRYCSIPLNEIVQAEGNEASSSGATNSGVMSGLHERLGGGGLPNLNIASRAALNTGFQSQGAHDRYRSDWFENFMDAAARSAGRGGNDPHTRELRQKLLREAFFDPNGHSIGLKFEGNSSEGMADLLCRLAALRQGGNNQAAYSNLPGTALRLAPSEEVLWRYQGPTFTGLTKLATGAPTRVFLTTSRLIEECQTKRETRVREVFPEKVRAIRWNVAGSEKFGSLSVEPDSTPLFRFTHARNIQAGSLPAQYKYFVEIYRKAPTAELEEFGAMIAALRQGVSAKSPQKDASEIPVRLAAEETLRYSQKLKASGGVKLEVWLTSYRLVIRCSRQGWASACEVMLDPSVRVACLPRGKSQSTVIVSWGDKQLERDTLRRVVSPHLTRGGLGIFESFYTKLGVVPSRTLIGFHNPGPLILPLSLDEGSALAERLSDELMGLQSGFDVHEAPAQTYVSGRATGDSAQPAPSEPSRLDVAQSDETVRTIPVRLGSSHGESAHLELTRSRIKIRKEASGPSAGPLLWQAPLHELRQFFRFGSGDNVSTIIVTSNPVLLGAERSEKKMLGGLFDFTSRYPVVSSSVQASKELSVVALQLLANGEATDNPPPNPATQPFVLAPHERLCRHYDLGAPFGLWLTTHRLILRRPDNGGTTWECFLTDIEGTQQERFAGRTFDGLYTLAVAAITVPLILSFPSVGSFVGAALLAGGVYSTRKKTSDAYVIPVTTSCWQDRTSFTTFGARPSDTVLIGPPRPSSLSAKDTEAFLREVAVPVSGPDGERMWREIGALITDLRTKGGSALELSDGENREPPAGLDGLASPNDEKSLGEWQVPGPREASGYRSQVSLTDRRLVIRQKIAAEGWNAERVWQVGVSGETRLEPLMFRTVYGVASGFRRIVGNGFRLFFGVGCFISLLLLGVSVVATLIFSQALSFSLRPPAGPLGFLVIVGGVFVLLSRSIPRSLRQSQGRKVPALTVLPRPWFRPKPGASPIRLRLGVSRVEGGESTPIKAWQDPLRPFRFRWIFREPSLPIPAAPLIPAEGSFASQVSATVNEMLQRMRSGVL